MGDVVVDLLLDGGLGGGILGSIQLAEQATQFTGVGRRRKVYSSRISALTEVFSCIDWSGSGPNSERSAATIQPDRYR